jgi:pyridoxine/pyridoxamine 5'-phosphate oxidase
LLKGIDRRGFVFFAHARIRKGCELLANPRAALTFYWQPTVSAEEPGQSEIGGIFQCGGGRRGLHYGA